MSNLPNPSDLILVAIMPSPRDMEIARLLGWYRIPIRTSPRVVAVDFLAFYQPSAFGDDHKWAIEYIASVDGHELVTRGELMSDEPNHPRALEEYFKLQLGEISALPNPIPAGKWKRINFLYTTGDRLNNAKSIDELSVYDEERQLLWRSLRERAASVNQYGVDDLPENPIDPKILAMFGFGFGDQSFKSGKHE
jgi:hypothetical protein